MIISKALRAVSSPDGESINVQVLNELGGLETLNIKTNVAAEISELIKGQYHEAGNRRIAIRDKEYVNPFDVPLGMPV